MGEHHKEDTCQEDWASKWGFEHPEGYCQDKYGYAVYEHHEGACQDHAHICSYLALRGRYILDEAFKCSSWACLPGQKQKCSYWHHGEVTSGPCKHQKGALLEKDKNATSQHLQKGTCQEEAFKCCYLKLLSLHSCDYFCKSLHQI